MREQPKRSNDTELHYQTLTEVARLIRTREISPVELTTAILSRIEIVDDHLKSYATLMSGQALAAAHRADEEIGAGRYRGPLHGVPIAVKDLCFTAGVRTMGGTAVLADFLPEHDATVVTKLSAAGAILLGKLNLTEGAMGGYHPERDLPLNPWDDGAWAGASSSGSGVATAAGLAFGTLGSDTGGSIRFPAAACGVVGLKPTWGRVSRYGVLALAESLDHVGPLTRTTADAAVMLQAIAGHDPNDPTSLPGSPPDLLSDITAGIGGLRIGFDEAYIARHASPQMAAAVAAGVRQLELLGATIVDVQLPDFDEFLPAWTTLCGAEAVVAHKMTYPNQRDRYGPWFRDWLDLGATVTGPDYVEAKYLRAACNGHLRAIFAAIDVLACPSMNGAAPPISRDEMYGSFGEFDDSRLRFTAPFDFSGAPTLSVPCGFDDQGLPLSLQFVGHHLDERLLCRVGHAYEQATEWHTQHPIP